MVRHLTCYGWKSETNLLTFAFEFIETPLLSEIIHTHFLGLYFIGMRTNLQAIWHTIHHFLGSCLHMKFYQNGTALLI